MGTLTDFLSKICLPRTFPEIDHDEKKIRVFSKEYLLGDVPPLVLSLLDQPVQVQLYHTYVKYFRVFVQGDSENDNPNYPAFFIIDLQLCSPEQFDFFIELPHVYKDPKIAAAVADIKNNKQGLPEVLRKERVKGIGKSIYINSQDFYQVPRYIPSSDFLPKLTSQGDLTLPSGLKQPTLTDFLESLLAVVIRCSSKLGVNRLRDFSSGTCVFARSWDCFRCLSVFFIKDDPANKCFRLRCHVDLGAGQKTVQDSSLEKEFTQSLNFNYSFIEKSFHARLELLDWDEKLVILKFVVDNIKININDDKGLDSILDSIDQSKVSKESQSLTVQAASITAQKTFILTAEKINFDICMSLLEVCQVPVGVSARCRPQSTLTIDERPVCLLISHPRNLCSSRPLAEREERQLRHSKVAQLQSRPRVLFERLS